MAKKEDPKKTEKDVKVEKKKIVGDRHPRYYYYA